MNDILNDLHGILILYKTGRAEEAWKELYLQVPQFQQTFMMLLSEGTEEEQKELLIVLQDLLDAMQRRDKVLIVDIITYVILPIFEEKLI